MHETHEGNTTMKALGPKLSALRLLVCILAIAGSAAAQAAEPRWQVRLGGLLVDGDQGFATEGEAGSRVLAGGNAEIGAGAAVEFRVSKRLGFELGAAFAEVPNYEDAEAFSGGDASIGNGPSFTATTVGLHLHLTPDRRADVYLGPAIALVQYGDFELDLGDGLVEFEVDDDFAWGATVGVDLGIGDGGWSINAAATYLESDMEVSERGSEGTVVVPFDPVMVRVGAAFSF